MVMPTFIGPTNLPVIEAFSMGCPVICSNVAGYEQQVGDAGLLIDPNSVEDLENAIYRICTDTALREILIKRGYQRVERLLSDDYGKQIAQIVQEVVHSCEPTHHDPPL
jgi:glycosyltransferase involved in cell wall biosynthesis